MGTAPGLYQIQTVLARMIRHGYKGRGPNRTRRPPSPRAYYTKEESVERNRTRCRERYRSRKAERDQAWQAIYALPDDEKELWNRYEVDIMALN